MTKLIRFSVVMVLMVCVLSSIGCSGFKYSTQRVIGEMTLTRLEELKMENEQLKAQLQQAALQIQNTQKVLGALNFPPQAARAFRQLGWQVKEQAQAPATQKKQEEK